MDRQRFIVDSRADLLAGLRQSRGDLAIAALVVAPFTLTLGVWVGWLTWASSPVLIGITLVAQMVATVWNAGWRARTAD
jgi:hypothetical protein